MHFSKGAGFNVSLWYICWIFYLVKIQLNPKISFKINMLEGNFLNTYVKPYGLTYRTLFPLSFGGIFEKMWPYTQRFFLGAKFCNLEREINKALETCTKVCLGGWVGGDWPTVATLWGGKKLEVTRFRQ